MRRPSPARKLWLSLLVLGVLAGGLSLIRAEEPLRLSRNLAGDSKQILVDADEVTTWVEGKQRIILLKGQVLVQHGIAQVRCDQAIARIDLDRFEQQHIVHFDLIADGNVKLANGSEKSEGKQGIADLHTRGEFKLNAHKSKVSQQAKPDDPLYRRLIGLLPGAADKPAPKTQTNASSGAGPAKPLQRTSFQDGPQKQPAAPSRPTETPVQRPSPPPPDPPPSSTPMAPLPELPPLPPDPGSSNIAPSTPSPPGPSPPGDVPDPPPPTHTLGPSATVPPIPGQPILAPGTPERQFTITPRTSAGFKGPYARVINGERVAVILGGVIVTVTGLDQAGVVDMEADSLIVWSRGGGQDVMNFNSPDARTSRQLEFYLAGNVEIREQNGKDVRTLRADEVYYDINRHVAIAVSADLQFNQPGVIEPIHFAADEIEETSATTFKAIKAEIFSSKTPANPGLKVVFAEATLEEKKVPRRSIFGETFTNRITGQPEIETQQLIRGDNVYLDLEDVPIFYLPFVQGDAKDPLGPIRSVSVGYNRVFGAQVGVSLNVFDLLALSPRPNQRWNLDVDYLSRRGPALGTTFDYLGSDPFGIPGRYIGHFNAFGIYDTAHDILGGVRDQIDSQHPPWRGDVQWRQNVQGLPLGFTVQTQLGLFSDHNFYEQYHKLQYDQDINQETYLYVKQQRDNWAWSAVTEQRIRNWVTETDRLPELEGHLIGESFFDLLSYNAHGSAGYYQLQPAHVPQPLVSPTDRRDNTGRFDFGQELSIPFALGPVKVVPYGVLDLTEYTSDLKGDAIGRVYGGGGVRFSMPLTHLYPDIESLLLNLNGINHKIVLTGNYYHADTNEHFSRFPQLDRLNDDVSDQAVRDIRPFEPIINPGHGGLLATSPLYDPQVYAIRRLVENRVDTLDDIEVFQADIRQRLQTKRGYPGMEHIIDWMTLDLSAMIYPRANRDNFGETFGFLEYDYLWNIGDRTALTSSGLFDPVDSGPRIFAIAATLNRPDRTFYSLGFRSIEPVGSQAVTAAITEVFSAKYSMTAATVYDFGTSQAVSNSLAFTRVGSDITVSVMISYNAMQNNFGFDLVVLPNLVAGSKKVPGLMGAQAVGGGLLGAR